jgi:hypothetical protein
VKTLVGTPDPPEEPEQPAWKTSASGSILNVNSANTFTFITGSQIVWTRVTPSG